MSTTLQSISVTLVSVSRTLQSISLTLLPMSRTLQSISLTLVPMSRTLQSNSLTLVSVSLTLQSISVTLVSVSWFSASLQRIAFLMLSFTYSYYNSLTSTLQRIVSTCAQKLFFLMAIYLNLSNTQSPELARGGLKSNFCGSLIFYGQLYV